MAKIKIGYAPTRRSIFSAPDAIKYRGLTAKRLEELGIEFVDITDINEEGLLYDENDYEVPATITDVYDNFNGLIIGKAVVSHKIELIDVSFKERILSLYALKLLQTETHAPLTRDEFINYFKDYYFT